jgi:hypothetical protein
MAHAIRTEQAQSKVQPRVVQKLSMVAKNPLVGVTDESSHMVQLKVRPKAVIAIHRLPFVGRPSPEEKFSFWNVPLSAGYINGCQTGRDLAVFTLIHLREQAKSEGAITDLGGIALSWLEAARSASPEELDTLRGQVVGFMAEISPWTISAVDRFGGNLNQVDRCQLLRRVNAGLLAGAKGIVSLDGLRVGR